HRRHTSGRRDRRRRRVMDPPSRRRRRLTLGWTCPLPHGASRYEECTMTEPAANIGVVGLAVMGSNLARNLASREGNTVAVFNRTRARTDELVAEHPEAGFVPTGSYAEFAAALRRPRTAIVMVKAGAPTDAVIDDLLAVFEPGDIIVDGGNALFTDTIRREKAVRATGVNFV